MGRNFSDPELRDVIKELPYEIVGHDDRINIKIHTNGEDKIVTPEEVLAIMLNHLVSTFLRSSILFSLSVF